MEQVNAKTRQEIAALLWKMERSLQQVQIKVFGTKDFMARTLVESATYAMLSPIQRLRQHLGITPRDEVASEVGQVSNESAN